MSSLKSLRLLKAAVSLSLISLLAACGGGGGGSSSGGGGGGDGGGSGGSAGFYEPFSSFSGSNIDTGIWLISAEQPGTAPIQVTKADVDLPLGAGATFYD